MFPTTKVTVRLKPQPTGTKDVIRLRLLERPWRWYLGVSYPWQAFMKTVVLSAILIFVPYHFVYYLAYSRAKEEILSKTDPKFTSDGMRTYIREFKKRQREGQVESMQPIIQRGDKNNSTFTRETAEYIYRDENEEEIDEV